MTSGASALIKEKAGPILAEVKKAQSILLHCHPSPDPDSVGSALAMKLALEQLGKKATVIRGDSEIPQAFMHFPGAKDIVAKNYFEIDLGQFDLFLVLDTGAKERISRLAAVEVPESLKMIVIDHHATTQPFGTVNLIDSDYPSCCEILYDLFGIWNIRITPDMARDLFIGMYTDTGGFKYVKTTSRTLAAAAALAAIAPDFPEMIFSMENANTPASLKFQGLALASIETFLGDKVAISSVSHEPLVSNKIGQADMSAHHIANLLKSVIGWDIGISFIESESGVVKASFRTRDAEVYDLGRLALAFGGGGHKAAAGATLKMSLDEAKKAVVAKIKELYNL